MKKRTSFHFQSSLLILALAILFPCSPSAQICQVSYVDSSGAVYLEGKPDDLEAGDLAKVTMNGHSLELIVTELYALITPGELYAGIDEEGIYLDGNLVSFLSEAGLGFREGDDWYIYEDLETASVTLQEKRVDEIIADAPDVTRTNKRSDYRSDEEFANFREVTDSLYRSCSPLDHYMGRSETADQLCRKAGVKTALNLCDTMEDVTQYLEEYDPEYYKTLNIIADHFYQDFLNEEEKQKLGMVLTELTRSEPPYLIHCVEGKDRTGFVLYLLESLLGWSEEDMAADYALSFRNYFHAGEELCDEIGNRAVKGFRRITEDDVKQYLRECGMEEEIIERLKECIQ